MAGGDAVRLWLVRHAAPLVAPGVCYGRSDVAADPVATAEAARRLHAVLPARFDWRVSSLRRTRQLAQALRAWRPGLPAPAVDERLCELDFGAWELRPWGEVPRGQLDAWAADFANYRPGGGESVRAMLARVRQVLTGLADPSSSDGHLWITHAGVIRSVQYLLAHGIQAVPERSEHWPVYAPACGEWLCLDVAEFLRRVRATGTLG